MKRTVRTAIAKMGINAYVNRPIGKMNTVQRLVARLALENTTAISIPTDFQHVLSTTTVIKELTPEHRTVLNDIVTRSRKLDCTRFMQETIQFYMRRHRFKFDEEVRTVVQDEQASFEAVEAVYASTVAGMEVQHGMFTKSLTRRRRPHAGSSRPIGPFNRYIRDQWALRRDELTAICTQSRSTDVMRVLSREWKDSVELRTQYECS